MSDPIKRASLNTLLCIVQCGAGSITETGKWANPGTANTRWVDYDQAEQEIKRRFKRIKARIKEMTR